MAADSRQHDIAGTDIARALDGWRDSLTEQCERPGWFWSRQHARVMSEIAEVKSSKLPRTAWAALTATIAVAISLLLPVQTAKQHRPLQPQKPAPVEISDHDLMIALERTMNSGVPSSLEPATLLSDEMNQALESGVQSQKSKEN